MGKWSTTVFAGNNYVRLRSSELHKSSVEECQGLCDDEPGVSRVTRD